MSDSHFASKNTTTPFYSRANAASIGSVFAINISGGHRLLGFGHDGYFKAANHGNGGGGFYSQAGQFYYVRGQGRMDKLEDIGIGFLALFGVSVQTAVVYISYVNELRLGGTKLAVAIREGAILRLRPIMMTALVAALGLLPAALATGVGTDTQRPFALVIVSGLFTRLLISIFLMPALYTLVARPDDRLEV